MDIATYLNAAKQMEAFGRLNVTTNNVANGSTTGFLADRMITNRSLTGDIYNKTSYPNNVQTMPDTASGGMSMTGRALDVALAGPGFFMIQTPEGIRYTKNGNFTRNSENILVTGQGYHVLSTDGQPIAFEEADGDPAIDSAGSLYYGVDNRGTIGVVEFDNPSLMRKSEHGMELLTTTQIAKEAEITKVKQGVLAESNVNNITETTNLILIQREAEITHQLAMDTYNMYRNANKTIAGQGGQ